MYSFFVYQICEKDLTDIADAFELHLAKVQEEPNQVELLYDLRLCQPIRIKSKMWSQ